MLELDTKLSETLTRESCAPPAQGFMLQETSSPGPVYILTNGARTVPHSRAHRAG